MTDANLEESKRLGACLASLRASLAVIGERINTYARDVKADQRHLWDARRDMDHIEKIAVREAVDQKLRSSEVLRQQEQKLLKLRRSPYFGRVDFARQGAETRAEPFYIGVHDFRDEDGADIRVFDWRAPVASLFYDHELGPAQYEAPSGVVEGRVDLKRQFRIRDGRLELLLESGVNVVDDVLQYELSQSSDDGMKSIVATIQRDQNTIIRDAEAHSLIIQGVAGSGKTAIALHRIAFLLYRFKDTLRAEDILIVSPNRVFADYIGNVLPELGEEKVEETGVEALADTLLDGKFKFESFGDQVNALLEGEDADLQARIAAKSSLEFLAQIDAYADHVERTCFKAAQWRSGRVIVPDWHFEETWLKLRGQPVGARIAELVGATEHKIFQHYKRELQPKQRRELCEAVRAMVRRPTLRAAYTGLFEWIGKPEWLKAKRGRLEFADVFPLIYLKLRLEGLESPYKDVKHLLIDEMQDYSPLQYAVLGKLFRCRKTVLGDAAQSVSPYGSSSANEIQQALRASRPVKLTRSYRSTWEIMQLALEIAPDAELAPMKRHGEPPAVLACKGKDQARAALVSEIRDFQGSPHRTLAVIAKTQRQAEVLHSDLSAEEIEAQLLDTQSAGFRAGVLVCCAHLAKGLEFDRVVIPNADARNYRNDMDRRLLYVACTRAMHRLTVIATGEPTKLITRCWSAAGA